MRRSTLSLCCSILCLVIVAVSVGTAATTPYVPEFWVDTGHTAELNITMWNETTHSWEVPSDSLYYIETPVIINVTNKDDEPVENATVTITGHNTYAELTTNATGIANPVYTFDYTEITRGEQQIAVKAIKPGYAYATAIIYVDYRGILEISVRTDSIYVDANIWNPDNSDAEIYYTIIVSDSSKASKDPVDSVNVTISHDADTDYVSLDCMPPGCKINFQTVDTDENGEVSFSVHTTEVGELQGAVFTATAEKEGYMSDSMMFTAPLTVECFIATAAYDSPVDEHLEVLRAFRDTVLLTNPVGRFIVGTYYTTSPPIADAVAESDNLRAATRLFLLTPLIYLSAICLNTMAFAAFVVLMLILLFVLKRHVKVLLKGIGYGALTVAAFTVTVFTLGALGYELPVCAAIAAFLLPLIIPAAVAVCIIVWIESRSQSIAVET
ncbi:MAG: hypothetical protein JW878_06130 [Methanomicrobia archaeon]|nr:hypothetical protein [Methanomicrobia archaeon]